MKDYIKPQEDKILCEFEHKGTLPVSQCFIMIAPTIFSKDKDGRWQWRQGDVIFQGDSKPPKLSQGE